MPPRDSLVLKPPLNTAARSCCHSAFTIEGVPNLPGGSSVPGWRLARIAPGSIQATPTDVLLPGTDGNCVPYIAGLPPTSGPMGCHLPASGTPSPPTAARSAGGLSLAGTPAGREGT